RRPPAPTPVTTTPTPVPPLLLAGTTPPASPLRDWSSDEPPAAPSIPQPSRAHLHSTRPAAWSNNILLPAGDIYDRVTRRRRVDRSEDRRVGPHGRPRLPAEPKSSYRPTTAWMV